MKKNAFTKKLYAREIDSRLRPRLVFEALSRREPQPPEDFQKPPEINASINGGKAKKIRAEINVHVTEEIGAA